MASQQHHSTTYAQELVLALNGLRSTHQRLILQQQLCHLAELDERITCLDEEIEERLRSFKAD